MMDDPDSNSQILSESQFNVDEETLTERLCELFEEGEENQLNDELEKIPIENLRNVILTLFVKEDEKLYSIANAVFESSLKKAAKSSVVIFLCESILKEQLTIMPTRMLSNFLVTIFHTVDAKTLISIVNMIKDGIGNGKIGPSGTLLELLPSLIFSIKTYRFVPGEKGQISSSKFVTGVIFDLCDVGAIWPPKVIAPMIRTMNELNLSDREIENGVNKCLTALESIDHHLIGPIVREMVRIRNKVTRTVVITGLLHIFGTPDMIKLDMENPKYNDDIILGLIITLRDQIQLDPDLGKLVLTVIQKNAEHSFFTSLGLFPFGLLLAITKLKRYEEQGIKIARSILSKLGAKRS